MIESIVFVAAISPLLSRLPIGLRQSLLMIFGNAAGQGFSALSLILITRALGPTQFGQFSVGFALLLMLVRLNDLGMTFAVQRYGAQAASNNERNAIFSYTLKIKLIAALVISIIGIVSGEWVAQLLNFDQPLIITAAFVLSGATMLYEHFQAMLQSLHRFAQSVLANGVQALVKFAGAVVIFFSSSAVISGSLQSGGSVASLETGSSVVVLGIFAWYMLAPVIPFLWYRRLFPAWLKLNMRQNFAKQRVLIQSLATHSAVGFMALGIIENIDILFVQGYLSTYEAGLLGGVSRIALLFNLMAYSLGTVLNPRVAKYKKFSDIQTFIRKSWLIVAASIVGFLVFIPFAPLVIKLTIGPEYAAGSSILVILMAAAFLSIAVMPFVALFFSFDLPWYFSLSGLIQLVIVVAGNWLFVPIFGLEAAAWTRLTARGALFVLSVGLAWWAYSRAKRGIVRDHSQSAAS